MLPLNQDMGVGSKPSSKLLNHRGLNVFDVTYAEWFNVHGSQLTRSNLSQTKVLRVKQVELHGSPKG